ncbi:L-fucose/L-arabinose isomerase family protein [Roseibium suaedae]|uniref:L-fucose isomerase n=1 Tax=Roseibium suaedae TaxID=735517 RepID=A0A1M7F2W0_9HYPH|nr:fucose isomerase [Roseibium suaedae]SHL98007.1 L-fucose isomerase [Roseibium suaedae]
MSNAVRKKMTLGVVIGSRAFFSPAPCKAARDEVLAQLEALGVDAVILPFEATANGAVQSIEDAKLYADHFRKNAERIDGLVICLPNFGDEIAVVELVNRARLNVPILLQASNDENDKVSVSQRRDAWCGKISVTNNFFQYGIPFSETSSHTMDISSAAFRADLEKFVSVCRVVGGLRGARLGAIGARTAPFQTMRYSEKLLQQAGVTVVTADMSELIGRASSLSADDADVAAIIAKIQGYGNVPAHITRDQLATQARWTVTVNRWIAENECDASAIQCWRSLQDNFGCATCVTMSMMGEDLMPSACEVDIMGALSMYALALASKAPPAILDWNNNFAHEPDKVVSTHCGNFPRSFIGDTPEIAELDVLGESIGRSKCFGAVKGKVRAGEMTYFRVSSDDTAGHLKVYLGEGEFTDDPYGMDGGIAVCRVPRLRQLMNFVTQNGFEHHVAMVRGHHAPVLNEALTRYLGWPFYDHDTPPEPQLFHPRRF